MWNRSKYTVTHCSSIHPEERSPNRRPPVNLFDALLRWFLDIFVEIACSWNRMMVVNWKCKLQEHIRCGIIINNKLMLKKYTHRPECQCSFKICTTKTKDQKQKTVCIDIHNYVFSKRNSHQKNIKYQLAPFEQIQITIELTFIPSITENFHYNEAVATPKMGAYIYICVCVCFIHISIPETFVNRHAALHV